MNLTLNVEIAIRKPSYKFLIYTSRVATKDEQKARNAYQKLKEFLYQGAWVQVRIRQGNEILVEDELNRPEGETGELPPEKIVA